MGTRKPTSLDIAFLAGVSQATVSRALRNSELVSKPTRERVQRIARELNYRVDRNAASLRSQTTQTLALLLFEDAVSDSDPINPFFLGMLGSITAAAAQRNYDLLVSFQRLEDDWHTDYEVANRADGLILLGYGDYLTYRPKLEELTAAGSHYVIWGPVTKDHPGHQVGSDNHTGARLAVEHLISLGRRRIAFIGDKAESAPEFRDRYHGYLAALGAAGLEADAALQRDCGHRVESGQAAVTALHESGVDFDAVFAVSDLIAIGVLRGLDKLGVRVPGAVSVVGFDDIPAASYVHPSLTTVRQDTQLAGRTLVGKLSDLIAGEEVASEELPLKLVVRGSCGGRDAPD